MKGFNSFALGFVALYHLAAASPQNNLNSDPNFNLCFPSGVANIDLTSKATINGPFKLGAILPDFSGHEYGIVQRSSRMNFFALGDFLRAIEFTLTNNKLEFGADSYYKVVEYEYQGPLYFLFTQQTTTGAPLAKFQARYKCNPVTKKPVLVLEYADGYRNNSIDAIGVNGPVAAFANLVIQKQQDPNNVVLLVEDVSRRD